MIYMTIYQLTDTYGQLILQTPNWRVAIAYKQTYGNSNWKINYGKDIPNTQRF